MTQLWGDIHPWDPSDPARACYTCGAPPDHRFPDKSPAYPRTCDHPPVFGRVASGPVCGPACRTGAGVLVTVPPDRVTTGLARCKAAVAWASARRARDNNGAEFRHHWANNPSSCVAEEAASIVLDRPVLGGGYQPGKADLEGGIEVRHTLRPDGRLILKPEDLPRSHRPFVLVVGRDDGPEGSAMTVMGWMIGALVMVDANWWRPNPAQEARGLRGCWMVPQAALHHPSHPPPETS